MSSNDTPNSNRSDSPGFLPSSPVVILEDGNSSTTSFSEALSASNSGVQEGSVQSHHSPSDTPLRTSSRSTSGNPSPMLDPMHASPEAPPPAGNRVVAQGLSNLSLDGHFEGIAGAGIAASAERIVDYSNVLAREGKFTFKYKRYDCTCFVDDKGIRWRWKRLGQTQERYVDHVEMLGLHSISKDYISLYACKTKASTLSERLQSSLSGSGSSLPAASVPKEESTELMRPRFLKCYKLRVPADQRHSFLQAASTLSERARALCHSVLVILNPMSGHKAGHKCFRKARSVFHAARIQTEVVETKYAGHAKQEIKQRKSLPDCIVVVGGDGTLQEVVEAMMMRPEESRKPIGIIAAGTEGAMAAMVTSKDPITAAFVIAKYHSVQAHDIMATSFTQVVHPTSVPVLSTEEQAMHSIAHVHGKIVDSFAQLGSAFEQDILPESSARPAEFVLPTFIAPDDDQSSVSDFEELADDEDSPNDDSLSKRDGGLVPTPSRTSSSSSSSNLSRAVSASSCASVAQEEFRWCTVGVSFGIVGDLVAVSERNRALPGHSRYIWGALRTMVDWKDHPATIYMHVLPFPKKESCGVHCPVCLDPRAPMHPPPKVGEGSSPQASPSAHPSPAYGCGATDPDLLDSGLEPEQAMRLRSHGIDVGLDRASGDVVLMGTFAFITALKAGPAKWDPWLHPSDGVVDVMVVPAISRSQLISIGGKYGTPDLFSDEHLFFFKVRHLRVESEGTGIPVNLDGEPACVKSAEVCIEPAAVNLLRGPPTPQLS